MTSIAGNLPPFVKDLGVSIVGKKCYVSLVENLNIGDIECLKYAVSKGLGIAIVAGGSVMKVPQMLLILKTGSVEGISLTSYVLETLSYAITLAYSVKNNFPFSTYGENLFLTIQDILTTLLIVVLSPGTHRVSISYRVALTLLAAAGTTYTLHSLPLSKLALLQIFTIPLSLFSKVPQIVQNARAESTGQLSAVAVLAQILGCVARLFTTATEVKDPLVLSGFTLALALNLILGTQMWMYWGKAKPAVPAKGKQAVKMEDKSEEIESPQVKAEKARDEGKSNSYEALGASHRFATPPPRSFSPAGSQRKWARKTVD